MVCSVRIQPTANRELEGIISYLLAFGPHTAKSFLESWEQMLEELHDGVIKHGLSRFPVLARLGYHTILVDDYIVLYFKEDSAAVIAHIFHQSQDYASIVINGLQD